MTEPPAELLEYPFPIDLRWNHIEWFPVFFRRLCASDFWLTADLDVRGVAVSMFAVAMECRPPATLPTDPAHIAPLLRLSTPQWAGLMARDITPLRGWRAVRCGREVRLTHPVLLEALGIAVRAAKLWQRGTTRREMWSPPDAGRAPG